MESHDDNTYALQRFSAGFAGGLAGSLAMNLLVRAVTAARGGRETPAAAPGRERTGRGVQPPQAEAVADDDATVRVGATAYRVVTGEEPSHRNALRLGSAAHYTFGAAAGAAYALLAPAIPSLTRGNGLVYGALVWVLADEIATPVLRLSRGPRALGPGLLALGLAGHLAYGVALDAVRRALDRPTGEPEPCAIGDWAEFPGYAGAGGTANG